MSLYDQFANPKGVIGELVGYLMALKNTRRSRWVLEVLAPQTGERILEVGFGSGTDILRLLSAVGQGGSVAGIDVSDVMVRQAARRCSGIASDSKVVDLRQGSVDTLPFPDDSFDAALSINNAQFWPELVHGLSELRRVIRPGGRVVVAVQTMKRGATRADSDRWLERLRDAAGAAGWEDVAESLGPTNPPVSVVRLVKRQ